MKKIIVRLAIIAALTLIPFQKSFAETYIGVAPGYSTKNESMTLGAWMSHDFSKAFRVNLGIDYVFRNQHTDAFLMNLDFNFPLKLTTGDKIDIYPIAGLTYACWSHHPYPDGDDVTTRENKFGINLGAGVGYKVSSHMRLKLDARYSLVKHNNTTILSLGIGYAF